MTLNQKKNKRKNAVFLYTGHSESLSKCGERYGNQRILKLQPCKRILGQSMIKKRPFISLFVVAIIIAMMTTAWFWPKQSYCKSAGGLVYCIPVEYFILPPIDPTGFLIRIKYPDMSPAPKAVDGVSILVEDAAHYYISPEIRGHLRQANPVGKTQKYGLLVAPPQPSGGDMIYYEPHTDVAGAQPSMIRCLRTEPDSEQSGSCGHRFVLGKRAFIIRYGGLLLPKWQEIKMDAIKLVESFRE